MLSTGLMFKSSQVKFSAVLDYAGGIFRLHCDTFNFKLIWLKDVVREIGLRIFADMKGQSSLVAATDLSKLITAKVFVPGARVPELLVAFFAVILPIIFRDLKKEGYIVTKAAYSPAKYSLYT